MKIFTINKSVLADPEGALKICMRLGWMPEDDDGVICIAVRESDIRLVEIIFGDVL